MKSTSPGASRRRRIQLLWFTAAVWTAAVAGACAWFGSQRLREHREEAWSGATMRVAGVQDALDLTFRHLAALPKNLAHQPSVIELLASLQLPQPPLVIPAAPAPAASVAPVTSAAPAATATAAPTAPDAASAAAQAWREGVRDRLLADPAVRRMRDVLDHAAIDLGLSVVLLLDRQGNTVADGIADRHAQPEVIGQNLRERLYFAHALQAGASSQFLVGRVSRGPGLYFGQRVERDGEPLGVVVVKQEVDALNGLLNQASESMVFITDPNGVVVLSNHRPSLLQRIPLPSTRSPQEWNELYQRVPEALEWRLAQMRTAGRAMRTAEWQGQRHLLLSSPLATQRFTVWVLAPLGDERAILAGVLSGGVATWAFGMLLMWAAWRRNQLLEGALQARRELLEMTQALPLTVFRYQLPASHRGGHFSLLGRGVEELFGVDARSLEADPSLPWRMAGIASETPPTQPTEFTLRRGDRPVRVLAHSTPQPQADGSTVYNGYWLDISARHETELRFEAVYEHALNGYLFFDRRRGVTHGNPATLRLFGADSMHQLLGRIVWFPELSPVHQPDGSESRERALALMRRHTRTGQRVQSFEWRFCRFGGGVFDADVSVIALDSVGEPQFCAVIQDITARKQAEVAMQQARAAAEAASHTKSSFLANMSHELRTPMNAIIGMTHLAIEDGLPPRQRNYIQKAHGAARNLLQILNDILDVSKIESGHVELEQVEFDLESVVGELTDVLALKSDEKGLELLFSLAPDLPVRVVGDPTRLRQVLVNLGNNAVKFTDAGEVVLGLERAGEVEGQVELHGWVRDTGVGLTHDQLSRLFQPFIQADSSTTRRFGGTGLGLVISRQLVERMGGRLWVDSEPGRGSTFHFTARFGRAGDDGDAPRHAAAAQGLRGRRALLADDNAAARDILARMMESFGIAVHRAVSGAQALEQLGHDPRSFDWVLVDWRMPGMDGAACLRQLLRAHPAQPGCILLANAFAREDAARAASDLRLAGVLAKPVTPSALLAALLGADRRDGAPAPPADGMTISDATREHLAGARILLAEDHPLNQELACELLRRAGMEVVLAENGEEALRKLASEGPFDGVLMDCQMPVMDGYTATRRLRADPNFEHLPVIAMTASALAEDRDRALAAGMNAHIPKPLNVGQMMRTMADWIVARREPLERSRGERPQGPSGLGVPDEPARPAEAAPSTDWSPGAGLGAIDTADGLARCLGKAHLYRRILRGFRDATCDFEEVVGAALARGDWEAAAARAHDLKGLSGTIGAHALHAGSQALHAAILARDAGAASAEFERVAPALAAVRREIGQLVDGG